MKFTIAALFCLSTSFQLSTAGSDDLVGLDEKINCTTWPKTAKLAIECCIVPEIFKQEIKHRCIANCTSPDPSFNSWCCSTHCIFDESGFLVEGHFSAENAKKELSAVLEKNPKTAHVATRIVDKCEKQVTETEMTQDRDKTVCATPQLGYIMSCIHQELFNLCADIKPDAECVEIQKFMERCPNRKHPPFKRSTQRTASKDRLGEAMKEAIRDPKEIGSIE